MSITAQLGLLRGAVAAAGAALPKPLAKALADFDRITTEARTYQPPSAVQAGDCILDCVLDGRDPLDDPDVRRYVTATALTSARGDLIGLQEAAERRIAAAIELHGEGLFAILVQAVDVAGQQLHDAHEILGDHDLDDAPSILNQGDDASRAWNSARTALAQLRHLNRGWVTLAELTHTASTTEPALRLAALNLDQYEQLGRKATPWDIVRAGATISCATPDSMRDRIDHVNAEREQRQTRAVGAFGEQFRRQHGTGLKVTT